MGPKLCRALFAWLALLPIPMLAASPARADLPLITDSLPIAECVPKATLPLPSCVPAEGWGEHAELTLLRAKAWVEVGRFEDAVRTIAVSDRRDLGIFVRAQVLLGEAWRGLSDRAAAGRAFEAASTAWESGGLGWIRSLPTDEVGERAVRLATHAAAVSVLRRAELRARDALVPLRAFGQRDAVPPFSPRPDAALTGAERAVREAWGRRRREAFVRYMQSKVAPWLVLQRAAIIRVQRDFLAVHLVPPAVPPEWRVAVAANIGMLWAEFVRRERALEASCGQACTSMFSSHYGTFDDPWERERSLARGAFEVCVALSREQRVLSEYTLTCEHWLAQNYRFEHPHHEELFPTAHWGRFPSSAVNPAERNDRHGTSWLNVSQLEHKR